MADDTARTARLRKSVHEDHALDLTELDNYLGFHMKRTDSVVFQHFSRLTPRRRMVRGEVAILMLIKTNPGSSQDSVCKAAGLDKSSISLALSKLESRNLIERRGTLDKRVRSLYLTPAGRAFLKRMSPVIELHEHEIAAQLTPGERALLIELLTRVFETVSRIPRRRSGASAASAGRKASRSKRSPRIAPQ